MGAVYFTVTMDALSSLDAYGGDFPSFGAASFVCSLSSFFSLYGSQELHQHAYLFAECRSCVWTLEPFGWFSLDSAFAWFSLACPVVSSASCVTSSSPDVHAAIAACIASHELTDSSAFEYCPSA